MHLNKKIVKLRRCKPAVSLPFFAAERNPVPGVLSCGMKSIIKSALKEDLDKKDITTLLTVPKKKKLKAVIVCHENGILCGIDVVAEVFSLRPYRAASPVIFKPLKKDGLRLKRNDKIAVIRGDAQTILTCERTALNFLSHLSGIATLTKRFVEKIKGTGALIYDTRKTTPNLRILEKYAVRVGGGHNHRRNLSDFILIKDNHLRAGGLIKYKNIDEERFKKLILSLKSKVSCKLEVEAESLKDFKIVSKYKPYIIMLDNFKLSQIKKAVAFRDAFYPAIKLEASGGMNLNNIRKIAQAGVDFISAGTITHSHQAIDFSLEII